MAKEKQGGLPLVSLPLRQRDAASDAKTELNARSSQLGGPVPLSVTSSPILGNRAAAKGRRLPPELSNNRFPDCCPVWRRALRNAMDVRPACKNISAPKKALLAPAMTAIRSPAGQACWRTSYGSFEASESWGWWSNILNLNLADLGQDPP